MAFGFFVFLENLNKFVIPMALNSRFWGEKTLINN